MRGSCLKINALAFGLKIFRASFSGFKLSLLRCRHAPAGHDQLANAVGAIANDRRLIVGLNAGQGRKIARSIAHRACQLDDGPLTRRQTVERYLARMHFATLFVSRIKIDQRLRPAVGTDHAHVQALETTWMRHAAAVRDNFDFVA